MTESSAPASSADGSSFIVVDLGKKQSSKQIKKLRKGNGKLTEKLKDLLDELRDQGTISADARPVVVVVREKKKRATAFGL